MPSITLHTAEFLLPMTGHEFVCNGEVAVDAGGRITHLGAKGSATVYDQVQRHHVLMPGVVNCHVHLTDAGVETPVPGGNGLNAWVHELMASRTSGPSSDASIQSVIGRMKASGTVCLGEVCNGFGTLLAVSASGIFCRFINELIGFRKDRAGAILERAIAELSAQPCPANIRPTFGAHAPYSVSPELLSSIISVNQERGSFTYEHLTEDPAERELYEEGSGHWREYLQQVGAWETTWQAKGCSPLQFYSDEGFLGPDFVGVHLANATEREVGLFASSGARAVLSPSSNVHINGILPPFPSIVASDIPFGLGTDGRGSNPSIDVFDEAALLATNFPGVSNGRLLKALTIGGAGILQFQDLVGSFEVGKRPGLISIETDIQSASIASIEEAILLTPRSRRLLV